MSTSYVGKKALIFGITGQTGSYLAEHLVSLGYEVHGVLRRSSSNFTTSRLDAVYEKIRKNCEWGDINDSLFVADIISRIQPDEIYNLAAQSHVHVSFNNPLSTSMTDALGILHILQSVKTLGLSERTRIYQAGTSEMYGGDPKDYKEAIWKEILEEGMSEETAFHPKSPYGAAKLYAHNLVQIYRQSYGLYAVGGICFNHESERRDPRFITRKVTFGISQIIKGIEDCLYVGNLEAVRDWGYAPDYAKGMHLALQLDTAQDFVFATGKTFTVRYLIEIAFNVVNVHLKWEGEGVDEQGVDKDTGRVYVKINPEKFRPNEVHFLKGNAKKARSLLNWKPSKTFESMIRDMVTYDLKRNYPKIASY